MSRSLAIICALAAGLLVGLQPPANASMARQVGDLGAALISMTISIVIAVALLFAVGDPGRLSGLSHFRPLWLIGGLGGAAVVTVGLITLADQLGWFGTHHAITVGRAGGVALVMLGTVLITRS
jgi:uncharacterized membrane protein YdcZ (DUF606 family)